MGLIYSLPAVNTISGRVKTFLNTFYIPLFFCFLLMIQFTHHRIHDLT